MKDIMDEAAAIVNSPRDKKGRFLGNGPNSELLKSGKSPAQIGEMTTRAALQWVWRWGWSSPSIIDYITIDSGRRGKAARLIERKLLKEHQPGTYAPDAPRKILTLTEYGKEELCRLDTDIDIALADHAIKWGQVRHDHIVQHIVAEKYVINRNLGRDFTYKSSAELYVENAQTRAQERVGRVPDAMIGKQAIEVELSIKDACELHRAVRGLCQMYEQGHIESVRIISTHQSMLKAYASLMRVGMKLTLYQRSSARTWVRAGTSRPLQHVPHAYYGLLKDSKAQYAWANSEPIYPGMVRWRVPDDLPKVDYQRDLLD